MEITKNVAGISKVCSKSKMPGHLALTGVRYGEGKAVATDSFSLIEVKSDLLDGDVFIVTELKAKKKAYAEVMGSNGQVVTVIEDGKKTLLESINESFPDYEKVMNSDEPLATLNVNAKFLANVANILSGFNQFSKVSLSIKKDRLEITTKGDNEEVRAVIMAINV